MTPESLSRSIRVPRDDGASVDGTTISVADSAALREFLGLVR